MRTEKREHPVIPKNPLSGFSKSGSAILAFTPQTMVIPPVLTRAKPSAVPIEPGRIVR